MPWKDLTQHEKIEQVRAAFGGLPHAPATSEFHHFGIHRGKDIPLGRRLSKVVSLGPDIVHVSPISNEKFLALWKVPLGETLLDPPVG